MSCFDNVETESLDHCLNREVPSGVSEVGIYYALHQQATTIPMPLGVGEAGYDYTKAVEVSEDLVFQAGKGFAKIKVQPATGEVLTESTGNMGNLKIKQTFNFFVPRTDAKTLGYIVTHKSSPQIFLVTETDGTKRLLGDKFVPAYISEVKGTSGKTGEDDRGIQFAITTYAAPIIYKGEIQEYVPA